MQSSRIRVAPMVGEDIAAVTAIDDPSHMTEAHLREELARPWSRLWTAREEGGPLGAFLVSWHVADELHVLNIATDTAFRRRGLARALLDTAVRFSREHRLRHALLEVRRSNAAAIALYRAVGFFAMGVRPRYYADDEDGIEMVLLFDPRTGAIVPHEDEVKLDG